MIFFTLNQVHSFCLVLFCGILCGAFSGILGVALLKNHQNHILSFIFKAIVGIIVSIFLVFSINIFYFGQFNIVIIVAFFIGFVWIYKTLKNLLDFFETKFYYICIRLHKWLKFYFERKHESIKD